MIRRESPSPGGRVLGCRRPLADCAPKFFAGESGSVPGIVKPSVPSMSDRARPSVLAGSTAGLGSWEQFDRQQRHVGLPPSAD